MCSAVAPPTMCSAQSSAAGATPAVSLPADETSSASGAQIVLPSRDTAIAAAVPATVPGRAAGSSTGLSAVPSIVPGAAESPNPDALPTDAATDAPAVTAPRLPAAGIPEPIRAMPTGLPAFTRADASPFRSVKAPEPKSPIQKERDSLARRILRASAHEPPQTFIDLTTCRDRSFCGSGWLYIAAYTADMVTTHGWIEHCLDCVETGGFFNGSRSGVKISLAWGGVLAANLIVSHAWKRHVRNKWLSALWPAGLEAMTETHAAAAIHNSSLY